jgi:sugar phosphate isomerase/epimerase
MTARNNPIWVMSSAFPGRSFEQVIERTREVGAQGIEACVIRHRGTRSDHIATHLDFEKFGPEEARRTVDAVHAAGLRLSIGAYENLIGVEEKARAANQDHLLRLIRMAALMGGDRNDVKVGTFVGYNHELGREDGGFAKNLEAYAKVFRPIVKYAEGLGVTILYENCPKEGWKLMYALVEIPTCGETYDWSRNTWKGGRKGFDLRPVGRKRSGEILYATFVPYDERFRVSNSLWDRTLPLKEENLVPPRVAA